MVLSRTPQALNPLKLKFRAFLLSGRSLAICGVEGGEVVLESLGLRSSVPELAHHAFAVKTNFVLLEDFQLLKPFLFLLHTPFRCDRHAFTLVVAQL